MTRKPRQLTPRVCLACKTDHGIEGPRPAGSAIKWVDGAMVYACSAACTDKLRWTHGYLQWGRPSGE